MEAELSVVFSWQRYKLEGGGCCYWW